MKALACFCVVNLISSRANTDEVLDSNVIVEELESLVCIIREMDFLFLTSVACHFSSNLSS